MEWHSYYAGRLEQAFQMIYLESPEGVLYGAGSPIDAVEIFQMTVGSEEMEHYPEVLSDDAAMIHLLEQAFEVETLITFDFDDRDGLTMSVRYDMVDTDGDRVFVSRKIDEGPVLFLAAADRSALGQLLSSLLLTLLGTNTAFGEQLSGDSLPSSVLNSRPDLIPAATIRKGIELLVQRGGEHGAFGISSLSDYVKRLGNPALRFMQAAGDGADPRAAHRDLVDLYFVSVYSEVD